MDAAEEAARRKSEELVETIRRIRESVRARHPSGSACPAGPVLPDLMPLLHARDAAEAKVAAIGTVNPRPPGLVNSLIQAAKRLIARVLDWHVREQVEFNRAMVDCVNASLEALNEANRALAHLTALHERTEDSWRQFQEQTGAALHDELKQLQDIRTHWDQWRQGWEHKLATNEIQFLRSVADLQSAFQHRVAQLESNFRDMVRSQHADFTTAMEASILELQKRLWSDFERIRDNYERLIHNELRVVRQRMAASSAEPRALSAAPAATPDRVSEFDYLRFADRFRGSEEAVRKRFEFYVDKFRGCASVLDLGCGRGEFLELMREAGVACRGIDTDPEFVALCRSKSLAVEHADLFDYLEALEDGSVDGIFCAQVVEHLPPHRLAVLSRLAAAKLPRGGLIAVETPNPECLATFASHFYLDPTHIRPVPKSLLVFCLEEAGFGAIEVHILSPAIESMPSLAGLPTDFREAFFGGLDYAVLARKL